MLWAWQAWSAHTKPGIIATCRSQALCSTALSCVHTAQLHQLPARTVPIMTSIIQRSLHPAEFDPRFWELWVASCMQARSSRSCAHLHSPRSSEEQAASVSAGLSSFAFQPCARRGSCCNTSCSCSESWVRASAKSIKEAEGEWLNEGYFQAKAPVTINPRIYWHGPAWAKSWTYGSLHTTCLLKGCNEREETLSDISCIHDVSIRWIHHGQGRAGGEGAELKFLLYEYHRSHRNKSSLYKCKI